MAYRLKLAEPLADGIRRVGLQQIDQAVRSLAADGNPHAGVHPARKCFKRVRALLWLVRGTIGEPVFAREDRRYRAIARQLSGPRDIQVMLDTIGVLDTLHDGAAGDDRLRTALVAWLRDRHHQAEQALKTGRTAQALDELDKARRAFKRLAIDTPSFDVVAAGAEACYRKGRRAAARAYEAGSDDGFHDWRKAVQRHWRHMQLLQAAWPDALTPQLMLARELSQMLGEDHDMAVLAAFVEDHQAMLGAPRAVRAYAGRCRLRQAELRRMAGVRGARLFAEKPKSFRTRLTAYWHTAAALAER